MKHAPATVLVDTHVLTDGTLQFIGYRPFQGSSTSACEDIAHRALLSATSHLAVSLREAIDSETVPFQHQPIAHYQSTVIRTIWHHGERFMSYCIGPISDIIKLCDLTENERENLETLSNRIGGEGELAFGLANGVTDQLVTNSPHYGSALQFAGIAVFKPVLFPHTVGIIERLQEKGKSVIYLSRDSAPVVNAVSHAAGISVDTVYAAKPDMHTPEMRIVANIPSKDYATFVSHYYDDAYVVQHDISELIKIK